MKGYVLMRKDVHGIRHEVYIPGVGVLWPELGELKSDEEYISNIKRILDTIEKGIDLSSTWPYTLIGKKEVSESFIKDFVGWIKSKQISEEGIRESGGKLSKQLGLDSNDLGYDKVLSKNVKVLLGNLRD